MRIHYLALLLAVAVPALLVSGLAATLLAPPSLAQCPQFNDNTSVISQDDCGNVDYDLAVINYWDDSVTDFGGQESFGSCYSSYYNCSNTFIPNGAIVAQAAYSDLGPDGTFYEDFEWFLDDYVVSYSSCNNGNPDDQVLNAPANSFPTQVYEANNDCD